MTLNPLTQEPRATLPTEETAKHLGLKPQTLRSWASKENGPLRPTRINGRLAWPVADLRRLVGQ
jgi:DNA-binding transcriptional MerR regulator